MRFEIQNFLFKFETKRQGVSTMSSFIKQTLKKVKRDYLSTPATHFNPQLLKTMNVTQLQIVINEIYDFSEKLNETLMKSLVERDELLSKRDTMLSAIEKNCGHKRRVD